MTSDIVKRQRTVPVQKVQELNWQRPVPERLINGAYFDRYDEVCRVSPLRPVRCRVAPPALSLLIINPRQSILLHVLEFYVQCVHSSHAHTLLWIRLSLIAVKFRWGVRLHNTRLDATVRAERLVFKFSVWKASAICSWPSYLMYSVIFGDINFYSALFTHQSTSYLKLTLRLLWRVAGYQMSLGWSAQLSPTNNEWVRVVL